SAFVGRIVLLSSCARETPFPALARVNSLSIALRLLKLRGLPRPRESRCARDQLLQEFRHGASRLSANRLPSLLAPSSAHLPDLDSAKSHSDAQTDAHWRKVRAVSIEKENRQNARAWQCLALRPASPILAVKGLCPR